MGGQKTRGGPPPLADLLHDAPRQVTLERWLTRDGPIAFQIVPVFSESSSASRLCISIARLSP